MGKIKERWEKRDTPGTPSDPSSQQNENRSRHVSGPACEAGTCDISYDRHSMQRRCRRCGHSVQSLTTGTRYPLPGDRRVVCHGPKHVETGACPIGPSKVVAEALPGLVIEMYNEHQRAAEDLYFWCDECELHVPGGPHDAKIVQFPLGDHDE